jgi:hypothetical protein
LTAVNIKVSELMPFVREASSIALDWTVGFVRPFKVPRRAGPPAVDLGLGGTGVLVVANDNYAILTADHVLQCLPDDGPIGLVLLDRRGLIYHRFLLDMRFLKKIRVGRGTEESLGPDLGLLSLTIDDVNRLKAKKSFYNLTIRKQSVSNLPPVNEISPWMIQGFIDELTEKTEPLPGMKANYAFKSITGPVPLAKTRQQDGFDYFSIEVSSNPNYTLPRSFGGASGCGIWYMMFDKAGGVDALRLDQLVLGGIAFYESEMNGERRFIECHGIRSVYDRAEAVLANGI